ncbi:MAG: LysM peptidoglycan-binding domain-containing protein [Neisseriaceae bacterium]|nr:MAG: LysM peptidoglycan-binding domain-containing protein [Neisseriaceae bacterium]
MKTRLIIKSLILCIASMPLVRADDLANNAQMLNASPMYQNDDLWQRMRDGFALNHKETPEVKYWEKKYSSPKYFNIIMKNAYPYLYFVVGEMERRGIPTELALVPIVESTYNPNAVSPTGISTGMWQFLTGSGKRFGMNINSQLDERQDIVKSTRGAVAYFQYLYGLFGSWELAIAAYNWGEGNINNAVNKAGSKDYYELDVRDVTKQYVPKVIALANIIQNPSKFGITLIDMPNKPYFAIAYPDAPIKVADFVSQANMSAELNKKLNPHFKSSSYLVKNEYILAPIGNNPFANNISQPVYATDTSEKQPSTSNNDIDPLGSLIAANSDADISSLNNNSSAAINILNEDNFVPTMRQTSAPLEITSSGSFTNYKVSQGDTLYSIARKFSVSVDQLKSDNNISDNGLSLEQTLKIRNNLNS